MNRKNEQKKWTKEESNSKQRRSEQTSRSTYSLIGFVKDEK